MHSSVALNLLRAAALMDLLLTVVGNCMTVSWLPLFGAASTQFMAVFATAYVVTELVVGIKDRKRSSRNRRTKVQPPEKKP